MASSLRPYKKAWTIEEALSEIQRNSGTRFDPQIVDVCVLVFSPEGMFSPQDVAQS
jgi:HD-GYP domain-containing protein (c-di-GMP phosphodiesterase class II)